MATIMSTIDDASATLDRLRLRLLLVAPHWITGGTALVAAVSACCGVLGAVAESFTVELAAGPPQIRSRQSTTDLRDVVAPSDVDGARQVGAEAAPAGARVPAAVRRCAR